MERLLKALMPPTGNHRGPRDVVRVTLGQVAKRRAESDAKVLDYDPVIAQADIDLILGHDPLRFL